jgi:hypothetical protein
MEVKIHAFIITTSGQKGLVTSPGTGDLIWGKGLLACQTFTCLFVTNSHKSLNWLQINFVRFQHHPLWSSICFLCATVDNSCHFLGAFENLRKATNICVMFRLWTGNNSVPTGWIFMKLYTWVYHEYVWWKFSFHENLMSMTGIWHEDQWAFVIIFGCVLLTMRDIQTKFIEKIKTHISSMFCWPCVSV